MKKLEEIGTSKICPAVAIVRDKKLLIGLRHYTADKWQAISVWTLPGGRCDNGEMVETALRREVVEEIGITHLSIDNFLGEVDGAKEGDVVYVFTGTTDQEPKLLESKKFSEWKWENMDKVPENFINPEALRLIQKFVRDPRVSKSYAEKLSKNSYGN